MQSKNIVVRPLTDFLEAADKATTENQKDRQSKYPKAVVNKPKPPKFKPDEPRKSVFVRDSPLWTLQSEQFGSDFNEAKIEAWSAQERENIELVRKFEWELNAYKIVQCPVPQFHDKSIEVSLINQLKAIDLIEDPAVRLSETEKLIEQHIDVTLRFFDPNKERQTFADVVTLATMQRTYRIKAKPGSMGSDTKSKLLSLDVLSANTAFCTIFNNQLVKASVVAQQYDESRYGMRTLASIISIVTNPSTNDDYNRYIDRIDPRLPETHKEVKDIKSKAKQRTLPVVYSCNTGLRPDEQLGIGYECWNGFQAFDLDLKNNSKKLSNAEVIDMLNAMHEKLSKFEWYMLSKPSVSETGLHIFTKVQAPGYIGGTLEQQREYNYKWFRASYYAKYCEIRTCLIELGLDLETLPQVIDKSMMKISQGVVLSYSPHVLINPNFEDRPISYKYDQCRSMRDPENLEFIVDRYEKAKVRSGKLVFEDLLTKIDLKAPTSEELYRDTSLWSPEYNPAYDPANYSTKKFEVKWAKSGIADIGQLDETKIPSGDRYTTRYRIVNTVVGNLGDTVMADEILRHVLKVGTVFPENEYRSMYNTGVAKGRTHDTILPVLQKLGITIELDDEIHEAIKENNLQLAKKALQEAYVPLINIKPDKVINLSEGEYLSSKKDEILGALKHNKINVLEAAPGIGKTHFFSKLAELMQVAIVLPFIATVQSKIETDEFKQTFDVYYGDKQFDSTSVKSAAMTIDKLSKMTLEQLSKFGCVVNDESHLNFRSNYRDEVCSNALTNYNLMVAANCDIDRQNNGISELMSMYGEAITVENGVTAIDTSDLPIVVMTTGTISGELLYYQQMGTLNYIQVNSVPKYRKLANFVLVRDSEAIPLAMASSIVTAILAGQKVIVPTNKGQVQIDYIVKLVNENLPVDMQINADTDCLYYKKDTKTDPRSISITRHQTFPDDLKILFCTNYLSVGVDIKSKHDYMFVYDQSEFAGPDIEQFNCRIREAEIKCDIIVVALDKNGQILPGILGDDSQLAIVDPTSAKFKDLFHDDKAIKMYRTNVGAFNDYTVELLLPEYMSLQSRLHAYEGSKEMRVKTDKLIINEFCTEFDRYFKVPSRVKSLLEDKYGYTVTISIYDNASQDKKDLSKKIHRLVRKNNKHQQSSLIYAVLEQLSKEYDTEKRDLTRTALHLRSDARADNSFDIMPDYMEIVVSNKYIEKLKPAILFFKQTRMTYSHKTFMSIVKQNIDSAGAFNFKEFRRLKKFITTAKSLLKGKASIALIDDIEAVKQFLFSLDESCYIEGKYHLDEFQFEELRQILLRHAEANFESVAKMGPLRTEKRKQELADKIMEFIRTILPGRIKKNKFGADEYVCSFRQIPKFDNQSFLFGIQVNDDFDMFFSAGIDDGQSEIETKAEEFVKARKIRMTSKVNEPSAYLAPPPPKVRTKLIIENNMMVMSFADS